MNLTHKWPVLAAGMAALIVSVITLSSGVRLADGSRVLPLDDAYIHMQYGYQAAGGHFLEYNSGEAPTSGATSLLYQLLIAGGFALGISRAAMPDALMMLGTLCLIGTAMLTADLAGLLAGRIAAEDDPLPESVISLSAGLLIAGSGWAAWGFHTGMETGLIVLLVTAALWAYGGDRLPLAAVFGSLAVLTRPEALGLAALIFGAELFRPALVPDGRTPRALLAHLRKEYTRFLLLAIPLLAGMVSPLVNLIVVGGAAASGFSSKTWLTIIPFDLPLIARQVAFAIWDLTISTLGGFPLMEQYPYAYTFPLAPLAALLGVIALWRRGASIERGLALVMALWVALIIVLTATLQTYGWHRHRYQLPMYPMLIVLAVVGLAGALNRLRWRGPGRAAALLAGLLIGGWTLGSLGNLIRSYRADTVATRDQQIAMADWLRVNTSPDDLIAVNDVGIMRYLGERHTIDVVGLTTAGMALVYREGPGASFEALSGYQPAFIATYPFGPPYWDTTPNNALLGEPLARFELPVYGAGMGGVQVITRPDWTISEGADLPVSPYILDQIAGMRPVAGIDSADLSSEAAAGYRYDFAGWRYPGHATLAHDFATRTAPDARFTDGLRVLTGGESFSVPTTPGEPLVLAGRFHQEVNIALDVAVDGIAAGVWRLPAVPGEWLEAAYVIPAERITGEHTTISIRVIDPAPGRVYSPAHYWLYQGDLPAVSRPSTPLDVPLGSWLTLSGADLPAGAITPGAAFDIRLFWQVTDQPQDDSDWRVFVHLLDAGGGVLAQADGAPGAGTRPFWTWGPGTTSRDTWTVTLPADLPAGAYRVVVGVYHPVTGQRLTLNPADDLGDDRYLLGEIAVTP